MVGGPDPLQLIPQQDWHKVQDAFRVNWPRGRIVYYVLETQRKYVKRLPGFTFNVYCPYGDPQKGVVAINDKVVSYEIIIDCPNDETSALEKALKETKIIDKKRNIYIAFSREHILGLVRSLFDHFEQKLTEVVNVKGFFKAKDTPPFEDVCLPPGVTFGFIPKEHIEIVDNTWPHQYPGSHKYFEFLIDNNSGYGLFLNGELVSWLWISDMGFLTHLYTPEGHRKKGYAELLTKLVANEILKNNSDVFDFVVEGNDAAMKLHHKIGFSRSTDFTWSLLESKLK